MTNDDSIRKMKSTRAALAAAKVQFDNAGDTRDIRPLARGLGILAGVLGEAFDDMIAEEERKVAGRPVGGPRGGGW